MGADKQFDGINFWQGEANTEFNRIEDWQNDANSKFIQIITLLEELK